MNNEIKPSKLFHVSFTENKPFHSKDYQLVAGLQRFKLEVSWDHEYLFLCPDYLIDEVSRFISACGNNYFIGE